MDCKRCSTAVNDWIVENSPRVTRNNVINDNYFKLNEQRGELQNGFDSKLGHSNENSASGNAVHIVQLMDRIEEREDHIRQIELELAQTKLALVEAQCKNQDLTHQVKLKTFFNFDHSLINHSLF